MTGQPDNLPFSLEVNDVQEYDSDDVSYRLRLLVKNNYFLPPAHSKPSPADFASSSLNSAKKSPRAATPTFLDIFRVGKSRSKPTTPTGTPPGFDPMAPMLRTTADSIAAPYALRSPLPRSSSQFPHLSSHMPNLAARGRVVVVREKMNDIAVAAKQAEQDLKARGVRQEQGSQKATPTAVEDVIDPTDAVDIPLLSPSYPFAVQASALHGLGVLESVGADVLADRLPPSKNPDISVSYDAAEDSWRKALLHEAVHHSLDNTPDVSFSHAPLESSTPFGSLRSKGAISPRVEAPNPTQLLIQQKILAQPILENFADSKSEKHMRQKSGQSHASVTGRGRNGSLAVPAADTTHDSSRPSSYLPQRVETPSGPMTPLGPPPRRHIVNPLYSLSQTNLAGSPQFSKDSSSRLSDDPRPTLRRTVSSPMLADGYDSSTPRGDLTASSQGPSYPRDSLVTFTSFNTIRGSYDHVNGGVAEVHDSENEDLPRNSLALSAMRSRPSLSDYSQASPSPTTSTFQDMLNHESSSSNHAGPSRYSIERQGIFQRTPSPRTNAMSPPPRLSSSLAHAALPPPPRSATSSQPLARRVFSPPPIMSSSESQSNHTGQTNSEDPTFQIVAPEPTTPPLPLSDRRNSSTDDPLSINIFSMTTPAAIRSTPGPTSPTSFFDTIQTQPNAMDDLESSSDESEDDEPSPSPPKLFVDPRTRAISSAATNPRPLVMRHGNFSTPYLRHGETFRQNLLPLGTVSSKQAVVNNPPRPPKADILSSSDFFKYAQEHPPTITSALNAEPNDSRRPSMGSDPVTTWRNNQKAQESLRKLDGMLIQHMEDEKDTIKRIATTMKQTTDSHSSSLPDRP
jgi:hypothetical protein